MIYKKAHVDVIRTYPGGKWVKVVDEKGNVEWVRSVNVISELAFEAIEIAKAEAMSEAEAMKEEI